MLKIRCVLIGLTLILIYFSVSFSYSNEPILDLTLIRCNFGYGYFLQNQNLGPWNFGILPMVAIKVPLDMKLYFSVNLTGAFSILINYEIGFGKEIKLNDNFSIEPFILGFMGKDEIFHNFVYGAEGYCRFNYLFNEHFKLFSGIGITSYNMGTVEFKYNLNSIYFVLETGVTFSL